MVAIYALITLLYTLMYPVLDFFYAFYISILQFIFA